MGAHPESRQTACVRAEQHVLQPRSKGMGAHGVFGGLATLVGIAVQHAFDQAGHDHGGRAFNATVRARHAPLDHIVGQVVAAQITPPTLAHALSQCLLALVRGDNGEAPGPCAVG